MPVFAASAPTATKPAVKSMVHANKNGRLVRTVVAPAIPRVPPAQLNQIVEKIARQEGVEAPLVHSVIRAESNYEVAAVSPKGAEGLMQLIPSTARRFGVTNTFDAEDNIQGGVKYLKFLLDYYHGDYTKSIAAYNAGEGAVDKYNGVPPYTETLNYVRTVANHLTAERQNQPNAVSMANPAQPETAETHHHIQSEIGADGLVYLKTP